LATSPCPALNLEALVNPTERQREGIAKFSEGAMEVSEGDDFVLDKWFIVDNQRVQVHDLDTGQGGDYIKQVSENGTTTLSYEKNQ
jgi:hypothetical protein